MNSNALRVCFSQSSDWNNPTTTISNDQAALNSSWCQFLILVLLKFLCIEEGTSWWKYILVV